MSLNLKRHAPADGLPGPLRGGGGGRPPVLFLAVAVFDFLAGVGGSEESVAGAFRFPELEAFCAVCAMSVNFGRSNRADAQIRGRRQKETTRKTQFNLCVQIRKSSRS